MIKLGKHWAADWDYDITNDEMYLIVAREFDRYQNEDAEAAKKAGYDGEVRPPTAIFLKIEHKVIEEAKRFDVRSREDFGNNLSREAYQAIFDALWRNHYRYSKEPTPEEGNAKIAAMIYHLEDMRKLVFKGK